VQNDTTTTTQRRRGFDALLDAGLTPAEVAQMRRQFYAGRGEEVPEGIEGAGTEGEHEHWGSAVVTSRMSTNCFLSPAIGLAEEEHARALEEQWIEGDMTAETATSESPASGSDTHLERNRFPSFS
jgi:hypothetical protein